MNMMSGRTKSASHVTSDNDNYADELNTFYARFDCHDFSKEREDIMQELRRNATSDPRPHIVIEESSVFKLMNKVNPNKARGPDNVQPRVIKLCAAQLSGIYCSIFNMSLLQCVIPKIWKTSCLVPVPKKQHISVMNDLRPIALTSCVMKIFERVVLVYIRSDVSDYIDPFQFAYVANRSVDDALLCVLNTIYKHLEKKGSSIRIMFYDFSSAFNTIQPHLLAQKLINMKIHPSTILWVLDYLSDRPQFVKIKRSPSQKLGPECDLTSKTIFTNTGAPQGTVLSPFLFSLYTADCRSMYDDVLLAKYADDSLQCGLITYDEELEEDDDAHYQEAIQAFVKWCIVNFLDLNVIKTKEMIIDFRKKRLEPPHVIIQGSEVERVLLYKYLGLIFDYLLNWKNNTDSIIKKANQRLYCLQRLAHFNVKESLLQRFYSSFVESSLTFGVTAWGGNVTQSDRHRIDRVISRSGKLVGRKLDSLETTHDNKTLRKVVRIFEDETHPLRVELDTLKSSRSSRLRAPSVKTNRYKNSFVPHAVRMYNRVNDRNSKRKCVSVSDDVPACKRRR